MPDERDELQRQRCLQACLDCHRACLQAALASGLGGTGDDLRVAMQCVDACRLASSLLSGASPLAAHACRLCAALCDVLVQRFADDAVHDDCVRASKVCATACREVAMRIDSPLTLVA